MQSSGCLDIMCHLPWRLPREKNRRILILPDGNGRTATNLEGYASGADNVVACAEYLAQRGDISTLVMCIVSDLNAQKRDERFFQAVSAQFSRLRTNIVTKGVFLRSGIRCQAFGDLARLRAMGGARAGLVDEVEGVCAETSAVYRARLKVEFWFAYAEDIAWQTDVDLVVRTGAEEPDVVRPGVSLPPHVPCVITTSLWPETKPEQISARIDFALRDEVPRFGPGYRLDFVEEVLHTLPRARVPAPMRLTVPVCAPESEILAMLERVYRHPQDAPAIATRYRDAPGANAHEFGPRDDAWYELCVIRAALWPEFARESYDAIITPGQPADSVRLAMPARAAHVHSCMEDTAQVLQAIRNAIRFPAKHVLLHGADRSKASTLASNPPWPADLLDLMQYVTRLPNLSIERVVQKCSPAEGDGADERAKLIQGISAKVLAMALDDGLLLPDEPVRQSDRNYAYTGAYMMLRLADESNPTGMKWERSAEIAIRCMLAVSAGDNGVFDRVLPGETSAEWRARLDASAGYFEAICTQDASVELPDIRGARLVEAIGRQWQTLLAPRANSSDELLEACRDALRRHYLANVRERIPEVVDNPLVHWLCIGGLPRREAVQEIERRYGQTTPPPIRDKIRELLDTDVSNPERFEAVRREIKLLLHLADTAHSIAVEVLFSCSALVTPREAVTAARLRALVDVGQMADYAFRLANDLASLNDTVGGDQDQTKESSVSILIPRISSAPERSLNVRLAREVGRTTLSYLEGHLGQAMATLRAEWPSMAEKVERAVRVGRGVYQQAHYTTLSSDEMLALIKRIDFAPPATEGCHDRRREFVAGIKRHALVGNSLHSVTAVV